MQCVPQYGKASPSLRWNFGVGVGSSYSSLPLCRSRSMDESHEKVK